MVFAYFIDVNIAFDSVDYWLLFCILIDNDLIAVNGLFVTLLLEFWHGNHANVHPVAEYFFRVFQDL